MHRLFTWAAKLLTDFITEAKTPKELIVLFFLLYSLPIYQQISNTKRRRFRPEPSDTILQKCQFPNIYINIDALDGS